MRVISVRGVFSVYTVKILNLYIKTNFLQGGAGRFTPPDAMKYSYVGKNFEVGNRLKARLEKKTAKLDKFFNQETEATATFSIIKNQHIFELTIFHNGILFRAEERSDDMYVSIDRVVDVIERQIRKNKTRLSRRIYENVYRAEDYAAVEELSDENEDSSYIVEESDYIIARTKKFQVKPMDVDEAILQMNLLGHEFFVFTNADTKQVNVVYKRKDDSYGLIEPEY